MDRTEIENLFRSISVWKRGHERAPHKPLLLLYALGRYSRGCDRMIAFADVDRDLRELLIEFGPFRRAYHPEYPFWHLQQDGIWEIEAVRDISVPPGKSPSRSVLLKYHAKGGFRAPIYEAVAMDPYLRASLAYILLEGHFPATLHDDILSAVGLDVAFTLVKRRRRDPEFRHRVLTAYEYRCAVCDYDVRLGNTHVGLEAAHIMWHQAGGPDTEANGLALCSLHHKLFDLGAFTLTERLVIVLSNQVYGNHRFDQYLLAFHGQSIRPPQDPGYVPEPMYIRWHRRQVFKGEERYIPQSAPAYGSSYAAEEDEKYHSE